MNIKLRRAAWDSEKKSLLTNIGAELVLPPTFSLNDVSVSKNIVSVTNRFSTNFLKSGYNKNNITIKGVIYLEGSHSNAEDLKDEIVSYITVQDRKMIIKIYQDSMDDKYWLGVNSNVDIIYSEKRSVIDVTLTFELEEPFRLGETQIVIIGNKTNELITNRSNVAFYPEKIISKSASIIPKFAVGTSVETDLTTGVTNSVVGASVYLKTFTGAVGTLGNACLSNLLQIPAGDFRLTTTDDSGAILSFYERWL